MKNLKIAFWAMTAALVVGVLSGMAPETVANAAGGTVLLSVVAYPRRAWSATKRSVCAAFRGARHIARKAMNGAA